MGEWIKTGVCAGVALVLGIFAAYYSLPQADLAQVDVRIGEPFFPELVDTDDAAALEVASYDEERNRPRVFRVEQGDEGVWRIPSQSNYPSDAEDQLANTVGELIGLERGSFRSDDPTLFASFGVLDPLAETGSAAGRGRSIKIEGPDGNVIAHLIVGKDVEDEERPGFKYVRAADENLVYAIDGSDLDISTRFEDWIETDLFDQITAADLDKIRRVISDPVEKDGKVAFEEKTVFELTKEENQWKLAGLEEGQETNTQAARELATTLADLQIVDVEAKPEGLEPDLTTRSGRFNAQQMLERGFVLLPNGRMGSEYGEFTLTDGDGQQYTLLLGVPVAMRREQGQAGTNADPDSGVERVRYVLVSASFDESKYPPIPDPEEEKAEEAKPEDAEKPAEGEEKPAEGEEKPAEGEDQSAEETKADEKPAEPEKTEEEKQAELEAKRREVERQRRERERKIEAGKAEAADIQARYARWYYLIPEASAELLLLDKAALSQKEQKEGEAAGKPNGAAPSIPGLDTIPGLDGLLPGAPPAAKEAPQE